MANPTWDETEPVEPDAPTWDDTEAVDSAVPQSSQPRLLPGDQALHKEELATGYMPGDPEITRQRMTKEDFARRQAGDTALEQTVSFGWADELRGAGAAVVAAAKNVLSGKTDKDSQSMLSDAIAAYDVTQSMSQEEAVTAQEQHPDEYFKGQALGTLATGALVPGGAVSTLPRAIGSGALMGAAQQLGESEDKSFTDAAAGGVSGGAGGALGYGIGKGLEKGVGWVGKKLNYLHKFGDEMVAERELAPIGVSKQDLKELGVDFDSQMIKLKSIASILKDEKVPLQANESRETLAALTNLVNRDTKRLKDIRATTTVLPKQIEQLADDIEAKAEDLFGYNGSNLIESDKGRFNYFKQHADKLRKMVATEDVPVINAGGMTFYRAGDAPKPVPLSDVRKLVKQIDDKISKFGQDASLPDADKRAVRGVLNRFETEAIDANYKLMGEWLETGANFSGLEESEAIIVRALAEDNFRVTAKAKFRLTHLLPALEAVEASLQKRVSEGQGQVEKAARNMMSPTAFGGAGVGALIGSQRSDGSLEGVAEGIVAGGVSGAVLGSRPAVRAAGQVLNNRMIALLGWASRNPELGQMLTENAARLKMQGGSVSGRVLYEMMRATHPEEMFDLEKEFLQASKPKTPRKKQTRTLFAAPPTGPAN